MAEIDDLVLGGEGDRRSRSGSGSLTAKRRRCTYADDDATTARPASIGLVSK